MGIHDEYVIRRPYLIQDLRLSQLGLSPEQMERGLGFPGYTRCLGYHDAKGGYTDIDALRYAAGVCQCSI